jgi:hypothetical protein
MVASLVASKAAATPTIWQSKNQSRNACMPYQTVMHYSVTAFRLSLTFHVLLYVAKTNCSELMQLFNICLKKHYALEGASASIIR